MNNLRDESALEDVLHEYASCPGGPSHSTLSEWVKKHPEYRRELEEFTASWILQDALRPQQPEKLDEETLLLRAMSAVQQVLYEEGARHAAEAAGPAEVAEPGLDSLMAEGKELGLDAQALAERCDLSVSLIAKLDRRLIAFASVPQQLVQKVADVLKTSASRVSAYLEQPMVLAGGARYRSGTRPGLPAKQQEFFDAVRADPTLSADQRARWLASQPPPDDLTES